MASAEQSSIKTRLIAWIRWPLALAIVSYMFWQHRDGFHRITAQQLLWGWVGAAIVLRSVSIGVACVRWWLLVRAQEIPFRLRDALRLGLLGNACNYVVPGTVGGDLTKVVLIAKDNPDAKATVTATVVLDRILGLMALLLVGASAALLHTDLWNHPQLSTGMLLLTTGSLVGVTALCVMLHPAAVRSRLWKRLSDLPKIGGIVEELTRGVSLYQQRRRTIVGCLLLSMAGHISSITACFCCVVALRQTVLAPGYLTHALLVPIAEVAASVLPLPGGIGAREGAMQYLYANLSSSGTAAGEAGFFVAIGFSLVSIVVAAAGAAVAMGLAGGREKSVQGASVELGPQSAAV